MQAGLATIPDMLEVLIQFSCVLALRFVVPTTVYFCEESVALALTAGQMCCNEVVQVLVNETVLVLICTIANYRIQDGVNFRFTSPEWMFGVGLMSWVSQDLTVTSSAGSVGQE